MARVRGVMARATPSASSAKVAGSMSTNTGVAPAITMVEAEATNENAVVITSSPGPTPTAASASRSASVPDALRLADRKSTRLNSSHANISYAVFCLKKKKIKRTSHDADDTTSPAGHHDA